MTRKNQANLSYDKIRETLLANELQPGERLKESLWAEKLGFNRADIRQAFARLHGEGLLVSGGKGGFFVRSYSDQEIHEIYELRAILEIAAARLAIERATQEDIHQLQEICNLMTILAENEYVFSIYEADLRFHSTLIRAAHNQRLEKIYFSAHLPLTFTKRASTPSKEMLLKDAIEHRQILDALIQKDLKTMTLLLTKSLTSNLIQ
jgi:DNA-binding GntR family transcriptional regulator